MRFTKGNDNHIRATLQSDLLGMWKIHQICSEENIERSWLCWSVTLKKHW